MTRRGFGIRQEWIVAIALSLSACGGEGGTAAGPGPVGPAPGSAVANEGWAHVSEGSPVTYRNNPPASGPHYPVWLRYREYAEAMPRGYWVHNLEHGGIVVLYRPDVSADVVRQVTEAFRAIPADPACGHPRALLTPDPALPRPIAVVAADFVFLADSVDAQAIRDFAVARRGRAPEQVCDHGTRP